MDHFAHCEALVRAADKDRFLATLFAPAQFRGALFALYAFNLEIARVREVVSDPMRGELRLQWWRDALASGAGEARAHPVAAALCATIDRFQLAVEPLVDLIEARSFDLYDDPMPSLAALEGYAAKTSASLLELAAGILDRPSPGLSDSARHAGIAYALTGLLRAFPLHAARGQLYLPLEVMERHGARPQDALTGRATPELGAALSEMRRHARAHFAAWARHPPAPPAAQAPAFLPVALVPLYLDRLDRAAGAPFVPLEVAQWRRQWTLWRAAQRA